jgi:signal transduction histidine kinase
MTNWSDHQAVLQTAPSRIVAVSGKGAVSFANRAALLLLERTHYDVIGSPLADVISSPELIERLAQLATDPAAGEHRFDIIWVAPSGARRELGVSLVCLQPRTPADVRFVLVLRDMGEWRQHEIDLRRLKGMNALGQMAAGFAHEVRNPLAAMRSLAEALKGEMAPDDPRTEYPTRMLNLTQRIEHLVKDALRFGRPKAPCFKMHLPQQLIADALETLAPRLGRGPRPQIDIENDLPFVRVDDSQAVEIFVNLIDNAIDACGSADQVRLNVYIHHEATIRFLRFDVVDNGPGMSDDVLQRVFQPFFTTKASGTGLGLAIAQRLARENGGDLFATSIANTATTFSLVLPLGETLV